MSMIRNGTNTMKPISKARRSSLIMNAGRRTRSDTGSRLVGGASCAMSRNSARSSSRTCRAMKERNGATVRSIPVAWSTRSAIIGSSPSRHAVSNAGAMTKPVRNSARPISTGFGGVCCRPIAVRRKESTITMRVKAVTITTRIDGARLSTVMSRTSRTIWPVAVGPAAPRLTLIDCAEADAGRSRRAAVIQAARGPAAGHDGSSAVGGGAAPLASRLTPAGPTASRCCRSAAADQHDAVATVQRQAAGDGERAGADRAAARPRRGGGPRPAGGEGPGRRRGRPRHAGCRP